MSQIWSPEEYAQHAYFVPALGNAVYKLLSPQPGERILDLGCGDGVLTERLVEAGASVVGVDTSPEMIAAARAKGLDVRLVDAASITFVNEFDAVFSNAVLHWVRNASGVARGVFRALKPGGRFVGEMGGHGNVAAITVAMLAGLKLRGVSEPEQYLPWFYPTAEEYQEILERAGFAVESLALIPRPTPLPTGMHGWLETFAKPCCAALPTADHEAYLSEVVELLRPVLCDREGNWTADYVRLRFEARKRG
jgi:SAM-dependent methyltransferase